MGVGIKVCIHSRAKEMLKTTTKKKKRKTKRLLHSLLPFPTLSLSLSLKTSLNLSQQKDEQKLHPPPLHPPRLSVDSLKFLTRNLTPLLWAMSLDFLFFNFLFVGKMSVTSSKQSRFLPLFPLFFLFFFYLFFYLFLLTVIFDRRRSAGQLYARLSLSKSCGFSVSAEQADT